VLAGSAHVDEARPAPAAPVQHLFERSVRGGVHATFGPD
jgi:hypothetical protein